MRRRLVVSSVLVALLAVLVLGLPLGFVAGRLVHQNAVHGLQDQARRLATRVEDDIEHGLAAPTAYLTRHAEGHRVVLVRAGARTAVGPRVARPRLRVDYVADAGRVVLFAPAGELREREEQIWLLVAGLSLAGVGVAVFLAMLVSRRVAAPLNALARTSTRMGAGDFSTRAAASGLPEVDAVVEALNHSADRIAELVTREREFSSNASHQLRTSLTALRIRLEEALAANDPRDVRVEASAALEQAERLSDVVEELLALARGHRAGESGDLDVAALVRSHVSMWSPAFRREDRAIAVVGDEVAIATAAPGPVGQALDVLIDNGFHHGRGEVSIEIRSPGSYVSLRVTDAGDGVPQGLEDHIFERSVSTGGTGVGLALARSLVELDGGRLELVKARPPAFVIFLTAPPGGKDRGDPASSARQVRDESPAAGSLRSTIRPT